MKAFENFLAKTRPPLICCENSGRFYWRAALEWAVKTSKELYEQDAPIGMQDVLDQELKEQ